MHDISITAEQLQAAAKWADFGKDMAPVNLRLEDDGTLYVVQGDDAVAFDLAGKQVSL